MKFVGLCCTVALLCSVIAGCGGGADGDLLPVQGTVTLDEKPLAGATIDFQPTAVGGSPSSGQTDASGAYTLMFTAAKAGAMPGGHTVRISKIAVVEESGDASSGDSGRPKKIAKETLPAKYNSKTELNVTVEKGKKIHNFDLKSE